MNTTHTTHGEKRRIYRQLANTPMLAAGAMGCSTFGVAYDPSWATWALFAMATTTVAFLLVKFAKTLDTVARDTDHNPEYRAVGKLPREGETTYLTPMD